MQTNPEPVGESSISAAECQSGLGVDLVDADQFSEAYAIAEHEGCAFPAEPAGVAIRSMAEHQTDSQPLNLTVLYALAACDACNGECSLPAMWPFTKTAS